MSSIEELEVQRKAAEKAVAEAQVPHLAEAVQKTADSTLISELRVIRESLVDADARNAISSLEVTLQSAFLVLQYALNRNRDIIANG